MNGFRLACRIGGRYTGLSPGRTLVGFISRLAMLGFILGVAVLMTVMSVMNGFDRELRERILGIVPHMQVTGAAPVRDWASLRETLQNLPGINDARPFIQQEGLLAHAGQAEGVLLYGLDLADPRGRASLAPYLDEATLTAWRADPSRLVLGAGVARRLGLHAGDAVLFLLPDPGNVHAVPEVRRYEVAGIFKTGTELDHHLTATGVQPLSESLGWGGAVQGLRVYLDDVMAAPRVRGDVYNALSGRYTVQDWTRSHGNLYRAIHLSKRLVAIVLCVLVAIAGFNVISALVMVVQEKRGDIAILKTLGASPELVLGVFLVQGVLVGLLGVGLGLGLGVIAAWLVPDAVRLIETVLDTHFLSSAIYPVSYLPSEVRWLDALWIGGVALLISALVSLYPAWQAGRTEPARVLRGE